MTQAKNGEQNYGHKPITGKCCAAVYNGPRSMAWHQCDRVATVHEAGGSFCRQHSTVALVARKLKSDAKYKDQRDRDDARWGKLNAFHPLYDFAEEVAVAGAAPTFLQVAAKRLVKKFKAYR